MTEIRATQEAEGEESLEPGRWRLQGAEITPLHSSLGDSMNPTENLHHIHICIHIHIHIYIIL